MIAEKGILQALRVICELPMTQRLPMKRNRDVRIEFQFVMMQPIHTFSRIRVLFLGLRLPWADQLRSFTDFVMTVPNPTISASHDFIELVLCEPIFPDRFRLFRPFHQMPTQIAPLIAK
jgi:hypothetical protein